MSLMTFLKGSPVRSREVAVTLPPKPLTDAEKAVRGLTLLIRQCKETPLVIYRERFGCSRMEICTELNSTQMAEVAALQAELEDELRTLYESA